MHREVSLIASVACEKMFIYSTYSAFSVLNTFQALIVLRSKDGKQNAPRGVRIVTLSISSH